MNSEEQIRQLEQHLEKIRGRVACLQLSLEVICSIKIGLFAAKGINSTSVIVDALKTQLNTFEQTQSEETEDFNKGLIYNSAQGW